MEEEALVTPEASGSRAVGTSIRSDPPTNRSLGIIQDAEAAALLDELGLTITAEMLESGRVDLDDEDDEDGQASDEDDSSERAENGADEGFFSRMVSGKPSKLLTPKADAAAPAAAAEVGVGPGDDAAAVGPDQGGDDGDDDPQAAHRGPPGVGAHVSFGTNTEDNGEEWEAAAAGDVEAPGRSISTDYGGRAERRPSLLTDLGVGFNALFNPPGAKDYLYETYVHRAFKPGAKDVDTQTLWEEIAPPPPTPPQPKRKSVFEQIGDDLFVKSYKDLDEDEEEEEAIRRAVIRQPEIDPERPNVALEFLMYVGTEAWERVLRPISRLPCSRRLRKLALANYQQLKDQPYLQTAYGWMTTNGGVLRYLCLATAAGADVCAVLDLLFVEGAKGLWTMHYIDVLLVAYIILAQTAAVLYELPPSPELMWVHGLADKWAYFLTRLLGRGCFYLFLGSLTAAKFSHGAGVLLGVLGVFFGLLQMCAGGGMVYLGYTVQQRMSELHDKLNDNASEKAKLDFAIAKVDPTRRGSIQKSQLGELIGGLQLELNDDDVEKAGAQLEGPSGLIQLDDFQSWYADRQLNLLSPQRRKEPESRPPAPEEPPTLIPEEP